MGRSRLTYTEALRILARGDSRINKLDQALGGVIMAAAPFTAGAALALLEPKSVAIGLLRELTDTAPGRIKAAKGKAHYELLEAAHAVLVLSAFFDAFRETIGDRGFGELEIAAEEIEAITGRVSQAPAMPSAVRGFAENTEDVISYFNVLCDEVLSFVEGLAGWQRVGRANRKKLRDDVVDKARRHYEERFVRLSVDLPEFGFWNTLDEHAATRNALRELHDLLASTFKTQDQVGDVERKLARRWGDVLGEALWRTDKRIPGINFPSVADGFVSPRFRLAIADKDSMPADEHWWSDRPIVDDLGTFLAHHLAHPDSPRLPLVILGHPGAGKTMMAEVLAARLPVDGYTPVLVRLRRVNADAALYRQIETALGNTLDESVSWGQMCRESKTTKVVIFDGFDELIQATGVTQSGYIEQIAEFQDRAWRDGHSIIPIVTSRTLVMDRARIPDGCLLIKLEDFDNAQVASWVEAWNEANAVIPGFRPLTAAELLHHGELARQPLLTTLLAIYAVESGVERLDAEELSRSELYRRLLDSFVTRQVRDKAAKELDVADRVKRENALRRDLAVAAFAMFNRGQQFISGAELENDLRIFSPEDKATDPTDFQQPLSRAERTIAAFFFVHVAQAGVARRTFEFLHATFGEYLVAEYSVYLLREVAGEQKRLRERVFGGQVDDRAFRALLSHQPLLKRRPVVEFLSGMISQDERMDLREACLELLATSRNRGTVDGLEAYEPTPFDPVTRLAAYSANLVTMACAAGYATVKELSRGVEWESTVRLWRAGLDPEGQESVFGALWRAPEDKVELALTDEPEINIVELNTAKLIDDTIAEVRIRSGMSISPHSPLTAEQVAIHRRVVSLLAFRWPVPAFDRLTLYDEFEYVQLADAAEAVSMADATVTLLLKLLIEDGPWLPEEIVSRLVAAMFSSDVAVGDLPFFPALLIRCPFLISEDWLARDALPRSSVHAFLLRRGVEQVPEPYRLRLAAAASLHEASLNTDSFTSPDVVAEMLDWAITAELPNVLVRAMLDALDEYGPMAWGRVAPSQVVRLFRQREWAALDDEWLKNYRQCHPEPEGLSDEDRALLGYS